MRMERAAIASSRVRGITTVMSNISVEVLENGLHVTQPGTSYAVTFLRNAECRMLEARDLLNAPNISGHEALFAAQAWKAAYDQAKSLGWI